MDAMVKGASSEVGSKNHTQWPGTNEHGSVPIDLLVPDDEQSRVFFDLAELFLLAENIRNNGQCEIVTVRILTDEERKSARIRKHFPQGRYLIIGGERRWVASKIAGMDTIEILVRVYKSRKEQDVAAFNMNVRQVSLTDYERARHARELADRHGWKTQAEVAFHLDLNQMTVSLYWAVLGSHPSVLERMHPSIPERERLKLPVAVLLARFEPKVQEQLILTMPKNLHTISEQKTWIRREARGKGISLPTHTRSPAKLRERVVTLAGIVERTVEELSLVTDFPTLFANATPEQVSVTVDMLGNAHKKLGKFLKLVEECGKKKEGKREERMETLATKPLPAKTKTSIPSAWARETKERRTDDQKKIPKPAHKLNKVTKVRPTVQSIRTPKRVEGHILSAAPVPTPEKKPLPSTRRKEWTVNCWDTNALRTVSKVVGPEEYIKLWDGKLLEFQRNKKPKPGHLPTREEAEAMLK